MKKGFLILAAAALLGIPGITQADDNTVTQKTKTTTKIVRHNPDSRVVEHRRVVVHRRARPRRVAVRRARVHRRGTAARQQVIQRHSSSSSSSSSTTTVQK